MIDSIVLFETAKLAKEKGFIYFNCLFPSDCLEKGRPTQSLLQKWLREVHNIHILLKPLYGGDKVEYRKVGWLCYTPFEDEKFNNLPSISISGNTYEEALEKGLQEALKLI